MSDIFYKLFSKEFFKKDVTVAVVAALIISICFAFAGFNNKCQDLRDNILRLHIIANSDDQNDQAIKLKVRDNLLNVSDGLYNNISSKQDAITVTSENLKLLKSAAEETIKKEGANYPVDVTIGKAYFNTRKYENFTLPAGEYEAVKVLIGNAKGKNWWCVMFPSMCIPAASEHSLDEAVNKNSAEIAQNATKYKISFKIVEIIEDIKNIFKNLF